MTYLRGLPFALRSLFVVVAGIAVLAYVISAWQVFGFARHVWRLPALLCFAAAIVADLLSLSGIFVTYLLREAKWHVRLYAWVVFLCMTSLSIAAGESFAVWRGLSKPEREKHEPVDPMFATAAIVIALTLAVHLLIVCVRHGDIARRALGEKPKVNETKEVKEKLTPPTTPTPPERTAGAAPVRRRPPRPASPPPPPSVSAEERDKRRGRPVDLNQQAMRDRVAAAVIARELQVADAAANNGVTTTSVRNWIASYRERHPDQPVDQPADQPTERPISGEKLQLTEAVTI